MPHPEELLTEKPQLNKDAAQSEYSAMDAPTPLNLDSQITLQIRGMQVVTPSAPGLQLIAPPGYDILDELGRGGTAVVYRARQTELNRVVAIKMLKAGSHATPEELRRFRMEAETVARLDHPNIVRIYAIQEHQGVPFLCLELVDGGNLDDLIQDQPQDPRVAAHLMIQLCHAIHTAHQHGVIHRDLKPSNVLLTADHVPKIADFGAAKLQLSQPQDQTHTGTIMGTPAYLAPEQALANREQIGPPADIYALGAILYELLTGQPPFTGENPLEIVAKVAKEEPRPPTHRVPEIPHELETICLKCLEKIPANRYSSAMEMAAELERWLIGDPIRSRASSRYRTLVRGLDRASRENALGIFSTLIAISCLLLLFLQKWQSTEEMDRFQTELEIQIPVVELLNDLQQLQSQPFDQRATPLSWWERIQPIQIRLENSSVDEQVLQDKIQTGLAQIRTIGRMVDACLQLQRWEMEARIVLQRPGYEADPDTTALVQEWTTIWKQAGVLLIQDDAHYRYELPDLPPNLSARLLPLLDLYLLLDRKTEARLTLFDQLQLLDTNEIRRTIRRNRQRPGNLENRLLIRPSARKTLEPETLLLLHRSFVAEQQLVDATVALNDARLRFPGSYALNVEMGLHTFLTHGTDARDGSEALRAAWSQDPERGELGLLLSMCWMSQQRWDLAEELLTHLSERPKPPTECWLALTALDEFRGRRESAEVHRRRYQAETPHSKILSQLLENQWLFK